MKIPTTDLGSIVALGRVSGLVFMFGFRHNVGFSVHLLVYVTGFGRVSGLDLDNKFTIIHNHYG